MAPITPNDSYPSFEEAEHSHPKKYYRLMQTPEESWKPYRLEPIYYDHPELGVYESTLFTSNPREGDYLVLEPNGDLYAVRPMDLERFDDVSFSAMPSMSELLAKGMIVEVPEAIRQLDFKLQDKMSILNADLIAEEILLDDLSQTMQLRRFGFPTKSAREAKEKYEALKPKFDLMCKEYSDLEAQLQEQVVDPLRALQSRTPQKMGLDQMLSNASVRATSQNGFEQKNMNFER